VLHCVALCCITLQCVVVRCSSKDGAECTFKLMIFFFSYSSIVKMQTLKSSTLEICTSRNFDNGHFCNALQHTAIHCNTLQHTATHCNTLQYAAIHCNTLRHTLQHTATHCNTLQHTATHCNTLQHTDLRCRVPTPPSSLCECA